MDNYQNALKIYSKNGLAVDAVVCEKCKQVVDKSDINAYYLICHRCVSRGGDIG